MAAYRAWCALGSPTKQAAATPAHQPKPASQGRPSRRPLRHTSQQPPSRRSLRRASRQQPRRRCPRQAATRWHLPSRRAVAGRHLPHPLQRPNGLHLHRRRRQPRSLSSRQRPAQASEQRRPVLSRRPNRQHPASAPRRQGLRQSSIRAKAAWRRPPQLLAPRQRLPGAVQLQRQRQAALLSRQRSLASSVPLPLPLGSRPQQVPQLALPSPPACCRFRCCRSCPGFAAFHRRCERCGCMRMLHQCRLQSAALPGCLLLTSRF